MESTSTSVRATVRWRREHAEPCTHTMHMPRTRHANAMQMPHTRRARATQAALATLRRAPCPAVSIVGNHELYNFDRAQLASASGEGAWLKHGDKEYHSFAPAAGWRVVVLDPYQLALIGHAQDDPRRLAAVRAHRR